MLTEAIGALPAGHRHNLLVTVDGAGFSPGLIDHLTGLNAHPDAAVPYSVGFDLDERVRRAIGRLPAAVGGRPWTPRDTPATARTSPRSPGCCGPTRPVTSWPADIRVFVRRERPHPGAQLSLFDHHEGYRFQVVATNTAGGQVPFLEARHRVQARVQDRIRCGKATGLRRLPSHSYAINTAWTSTVRIAGDLLAWLRQLALDSELAVAEPKTLRYRLRHTAGRIVRGQRRHRRKLPAG